MEIRKEWLKKEVYLVKEDYEHLRIIINKREIEYSIKDN